MILRQEQKILPLIFLDRDVLGFLPPWVDEGGVILFTLDFLPYLKVALLTNVGIPPLTNTSMLFPNIWKIVIKAFQSSFVCFLAM